MPIVMCHADARFVFRWTNVVIDASERRVVKILAGLSAVIGMDVGAVVKNASSQVATVAMDQRQRLDGRPSAKPRPLFLPPSIPTVT